MEQKDRKKILFILPSLARAGAEIQTVDLINGLQACSFEKYFFTFEKSMEQLQRIDLANVSYSHCQKKSKVDLDVIREIASIIDEKRIDVVHCSLQIALFMGWFGVKFAKRTPKLVLAIHTTINRNRRNEFADVLLYQWLMRSCSHFIFVCKAQQVFWIKKFSFVRDRSTVIYNGVDVDYFKPSKEINQQSKGLKKRINIPSNAKVICHVAAFRPEKGHAILLEAFKRIYDETPDAYLIFAGDGDLKSNIEKQAYEYGLTQNVLFLGNVADVRPVLALADISVLASTAETFSIAMLESLAMELPMVAPNIGGVAEGILHKETGYIIQKSDAEQLYLGLTYLLANDSLRMAMARKGRERVKKFFAKEIMVKKTAKLFQSIIG